MVHKKRRRFTSEEKKLILKRHFLEKKTVSDLMEFGLPMTYVIKWLIDPFKKLQTICQYGLFVGNDSGIMNLAVGVGTPTIGTMDPTSPFKTDPYGNKHCKLGLFSECSPC